MESKIIFKPGDRVIFGCGAEIKATLVAPCMEKSWRPEDRGAMIPMLCGGDFDDHEPEQLWMLKCDDGENRCYACQHSMKKLSDV